MLRFVSFGFSIASQYLLQLRSLQSDKMQALYSRLIYSDFLFLHNSSSNHPHGPISSDAELWVDLETSFHGIPEAAHTRLRNRMPPAQPYTFTHTDLTDVNIMVENGNLTGIIDWELTRFFPVW